MDSNRTIDISYLAYSKKNTSPYIFEQNIVSLLSFDMTQAPRLRELGFGIRYHIAVSPILLTSERISLLQNLSVEISKIDIEGEAIVPILQAEHICQSFKKTAGRYFISLDGDTTFLRPFCHEVLSALEDDLGEIALVPECGSTGILPFMNFNCGFMFFKRSEVTHLLLKSWAELCRYNSGISKHGNQRIFPSAIRTAKPRIFPLDIVYNLRCHPVYGNAAQVWSPVYMVHAHRLTKSILQSLRIKGIALDCSSPSTIRAHLLEIIQETDLHFTPKNEPYRPRYVHAPGPIIFG